MPKAVESDPLGEAGAEQGRLEVATIVVVPELAAAGGEEHAREVVGSALDDLSPNRWPMRFAETSLNLGLAAAHRGDIDQAANLGTRVLSIGRKSAAAFGRFAELDEAMTERAPTEPAVRDFHERFARRGGSCRIPSAEGNQHLDGAESEPAARGDAAAEAATVRARIDG